MWPLIGAIAYRIRGGLLDDLLGRELPNFIGRAIWSLAVVAALWDKADVTPAFLLAYLGCAVGYFNAEFDLLPARNRVLMNYARLAARGMFTMFPLALYLHLFTDVNIWWSVLVGALLPACYASGITIYCYSKAMAYSQWGEFLFGALIMWSLT